MFSDRTWSPLKGGYLQLYGVGPDRFSDNVFTNAQTTRKQIQ